MFAPSVGVRFLRKNKRRQRVRKAARTTRPCGAGTDPTLQSEGTTEYTEDIERPFLAILAVECLVCGAVSETRNGHGSASGQLQTETCGPRSLHSGSRACQANLIRAQPCHRWSRSFGPIVIEGLRCRVDRRPSLRIIASRHCAGRRLRLMLIVALRSTAVLRERSRESRRPIPDFRACSSLDSAEIGCTLGATRSAV